MDSKHCLNLVICICIHISRFCAANSDNANTMPNDGYLTFQQSILSSFDRIQTQLQTLQTKSSCPSVSELQYSLRHVYDSIASCHASVATETKLRRLTGLQSDKLRRLQETHTRLTQLRGDLHEGKRRELQLREKIRLETDTLEGFCAGGTTVKGTTPTGSNFTSNIRVDIISSGHKKDDNDDDDDDDDNDDDDDDDDGERRVNIRLQKVGTAMKKLAVADVMRAKEIQQLQTRTDRLAAVDAQHSRQLQGLTNTQQSLVERTAHQNSQVTRLVAEARARARDNDRQFAQIQRLHNDTLTLIETDLQQKQHIKKIEPSAVVLTKGPSPVDVTRLKSDIQRIEVGHQVQNKIMDEIKSQIIELKNTSSSLEEDLSTFTKSVETLKETVAIQNETIRFINKRNEIQSKPRSKFSAVSAPLDGHFYAYSKRMRVNMTMFQTKNKWRSSKWSKFCAESAPYNGRTYTYSKPMRLNMPHFQELCGELGGYVVEINTQEEYSFIKQFVRQSGVVPHGYSYSERDNIMIGRSDAAEEGVWTYMHSKAPVTFSNWHPGEPNGKHRRNCVNLYAFHFHMHDTKCVDRGWQRRFICEVPV